MWLNSNGMIIPRHEINIGVMQNRCYFYIIMCAASMWVTSMCLSSDENKICRRSFFFYMNATSKVGAFVHSNWPSKCNWMESIKLKPSATHKQTYVWILCNLRRVSFCFVISHERAILMNKLRRERVFAIENTDTYIGIIGELALGVEKKGAANLLVGIQTHTFMVSII